MSTTTVPPVPVAVPSPIAATRSRRTGLVRVAGGIALAVALGALAAGCSGAPTPGGTAPTPTVTINGVVHEIVTGIGTADQVVRARTWTTSNRRRWTSPRSTRP